MGIKNDDLMKEIHAIKEYELPEEERIFKVKDGEQKLTFVYDFDLMSAEQVITASDKFDIAQKLKDIPAKNMTELEESTTRATMKRAIADILLKQDADGNIVPYDPSAPDGLLALKLIIGGKNVQRLLRCRDHFLFAAGISTGLFTEQLNNGMRELKEMGMSDEMITSVIIAGMSGENTEQLISTAQKSMQEDMSADKQAQP